MTDNPYSDSDPASNMLKPKKWTLVVLVYFFVIGSIALGLIAQMLPNGKSERPAVRRTQCKNNLKQIGQALLNYESTYGALPPAHTVDIDGKPLHSWRTLILPFLDQQQLYATIDLSKPWNHPANAHAYETKNHVFQCPSTLTDVKNYTTYMAVVASNGCFHPDEPRKLSQITDSRSETIMLIEVSPEYAVHWMSPLDAGESMVTSFGSESKCAHQSGNHVLLVDGICRLLSGYSSPATRRALISISENDRPGEF